MTKEQIKAKVAATIAGQGNQVDIAGTLAEILDAIVDNIPESETIIDISDIPNTNILELLPEGVDYEKIENALQIIDGRRKLIRVTSPMITISDDIRRPQDMQGSTAIVFLEAPYTYLEENEYVIFPNSVYFVIYEDNNELFYVKGEI